MFETHKKSLLWVLMGLVAIVLVWVVVWLVARSSRVTPVVEAPAPAPVVEVSKPAPVVIAPSKVTPKMSYADAFALYSKTRVQLGAKCNPTPFAPVYKNGATIMIDNRSGENRIVAVGETTYHVNAYDYVLATLSYPEATLPVKVLLDCGNTQNVATLTVEK